MLVGSGEGESMSLSSAFAPAIHVAGLTQAGNVRMEVEIIVVALASFVGGGAMGAGGMLLCQWVVRKMSPPPLYQLGSMDPRDVEVMKADVADLAVRLHSVDARLDFTEQLLGGALSGARPPEPLPPPQLPLAQGSDGLNAEASSDREHTSSEREHTSSDGQDTASDEEDALSDEGNASSDAEDTPLNARDASR